MTLVYSTDKSRPLNEGPCKMRLESKGRGGKQVTVLFNLPFNAVQAEEVFKTLQTKLSTGGTFKDEQMQFRGDVRSRVEEFFTKNGWKIVRAGG